MDGTITLRPVEPGDEGHLRAIYASTREDELAQVDWDAAQREAFLRTQFDAQHRYYHEYYPRGEFQLILVDAAAAGRLYVNRGTTEIRIIDIALLPAYRNAGIGTGLLRDLLGEAERAGKPLTIHVERFSPALRLYTRLGFRQIADRGYYLLLEWRPGRPPTSG